MSIAIEIINDLRVPRMDPNHLGKLDNSKHEFITRHMPGKYFQSGLDGFFRFGTVEGYKATEEAIIGRFGDHQEGSHLDIFHNNSGKFMGLNIMGGNIVEANIQGYDQQVVHRTVANEYCACASRGGYDPNRAQKLKANGNGDLEAFIVYDYPKIKQVLVDIIKEKNIFPSPFIFVRDVQYRDKDRLNLIPDDQQFIDAEQVIEKWMNIIFTKDKRFSHEEEVRILAVNPSKLNSIGVGAEALNLQDRRISECIVDSGMI